MNADEARYKLNYILDNKKVQPLVDKAIEDSLRQESDRVAIKIRRNDSLEDKIVDYLRDNSFKDIVIRYIEEPTGIYETRPELMTVITFSF
jgi:hypothetical protein